MPTPAQQQSRSRTIKLPATMYREFTVERAVRVDGVDGADANPTVYPLVFSSETPVRRWGWDIGEYMEILGHTAAEVDLSRAKNGLPLLQSHQRLLVAGSVKEIELDERRKCLNGSGRFASTDCGQEQKTLLDEDHVRTLSVGYRVLSMTLVSKDKNGIPTYRCAWQPCEVSMEPIPADMKAAVSRGEDAPTIELTLTEPVEEGERAMPQDLSPSAIATPATPAAIQTRGEGADPGSAPAPAPAAARVETRDRGAEVAEILELCEAHGQTARAAGWIRSGLAPSEVGREILKLVRTQGQPAPGSEAIDGMPAQDRSRYSVLRAVRMQMELMQGQRGRIDGLEAEVHQELAKTRAGADHGGIIVPWRLRSQGDPSLAAARALGSTQASGGASLVSQTVMPDMIDLLRNKALVLKMGAKFYPGMQGVVYFNRKTGAPDVSWTEEAPAADASASSPSYGYLLMSPKPLIGIVEVPRVLLGLTAPSFDLEADIRKDLALGHALAWDYAALHGKGADKQPVGLYSAADVQPQAMGGVPTFAKVSDMTAMVADQNADLEALGWMTTPLLAGVMKRTPEVSGYPQWVWKGKFIDGEMAGYPANATNQMSKVLGAGGNEHGMIFGNWAAVAIAAWGNDLELVVDVVTKAARGQIVITSYSMGDVGVLRPTAFVKATGATIS